MSTSSKNILENIASTSSLISARSKTNTASHTFPKLDLAWHCNGHCPLGSVHVCLQTYFKKTAHDLLYQNLPIKYLAPKFCHIYTTGLTRPRSLDRSARWSLVNLPNIWNWPNISGKFTVNVPNLWNVFVVVVVFVHHVHFEERGSEGMKEIRSHTPGLPSFFVSYKRIHNIVMTETRELRKEDNVFRNKHQMLGTHVHQVHHVHHWLKFLLRTDERTDGRTGVA